MLKSMTGYGRGEVKDKSRHFIVEVKSINNRFFDCSVKMPYEFDEIEQQIIKLVKNTVKRGRVDIFVSTGEEDNKSEVKVSINQELAAEYYKHLKLLQKRLDLPDNIDLNMLLKFSEIVKENKIYNISEDVKTVLLEAVDNALKNYDNMRIEEGKIIYNDMCDRVKILKDELVKVEKTYKQSLTEYKNNLIKKIKELATDVKIDDARLAMEIALIAEKSDITEEIIRLTSHVGQFSDACKNNKNAIGRKLDFIVQEMNREVNTIGSKCNNFEISTSVIILKEELEKIREQIQNVE